MTGILKTGMKGTITVNKCGEEKIIYIKDNIELWGITIDYMKIWIVVSESNSYVSIGGVAYDPRV